MNDKMLVFLAEEQLLEAKGHCDVLKNKWWVVHPDKGLTFYSRRGSLKGSSPQCNSSRSVATTLATRMYPWAIIKQIPIVLVPIDLDDFQEKP